MKSVNKKHKTLIMGILNVTPDSFYDGGRFNSLKNALGQVERLIADGADIIDVGGESTRPGSESVSEGEELHRVIPVISEIKKRFNIPVSVDTTKSEVARAALQNGAEIVNDISGLGFDPEIANTVKEHDAKIILCHTSSRPIDMQQKTSYGDIISDICNYLQNSINISQQNGILSDNICIDPGFGFGKTAKDNLLLLKHLSKFKKLGKKIVVGTSMKSFIGKTLQSEDVNKRIYGTFATTVISVLHGADIVRVHDVKKMKIAVDMADCVINT
ncbi:MAG: dihydropteroate synthase [Candidatus Dadabacteria bacterium]|nr:dihydropteroate synthase [Candidatus Dadabacteria bacterium]NIS07822.1 dihydropteroate synthase [Candidatus Dadabacteria bacterium]NIV42776.1 dihydropteroate synthase [Candidatus Dadabacteria bacterium]NIX14841.1 dihydropteroate synthase [Candidatus Dadabacteria bacterium]NIY21441.1 dihydropteroate synthase [Candidatus Dadabacteria bacterium]